MIKPTRLLLPLLMAGALLQVACKHKATGISEYTAGPDRPPAAVIKDGVAITLRDQKLTVLRNGKKVKDYDISTSKFGIGGTSGSYRTPTGVHAVTRKVGDGQPIGMVFKGCRPTGEVVGVDAPGRDPIVTRVIQIAGLEKYNSNSHNRRIYIHGTPEERNIGRPASYGCIRMRSEDVVDLYPQVHRGMPVVIERCSQDMYLRSERDGVTPGMRLSANISDFLPKEEARRRVAYRSGKRTLRSSRRAIGRSTRVAARKLKARKSRKMARRTLRRRG
ncbi:MAG: L,D-transpeptidase [Akkermansia sp.]|nr:L,D-transpeptidase [Akkermansia sp.]